MSVEGVKRWRGRTVYARQDSHVSARTQWPPDRSQRDALSFAPHGGHFNVVDNGFPMRPIASALAHSAGRELHLVELAAC